MSWSRPAAAHGLVLAPIALGVARDVAAASSSARGSRQRVRDDRVSGCSRGMAQPINASGCQLNTISRYFVTRAQVRRVQLKRPWVHLRRPPTTPKPGLVAPALAAADVTRLSRRHARGVAIDSDATATRRHVEQRSLQRLYSSAWSWSVSALSRCAPGYFSRDLLESLKASLGGDSLPTLMACAR
jgi:hypothetical protein